LNYLVYKFETDQSVDPAPW